MKYESNILKRLIDTYGVVGNPRYISEIIKEFIVQGKERFPNLFTYQADWLAHIDEFGLNPSYTVSYTGQSIYAPNTLERPVKSAILKGQTLVNLFPNLLTGEFKKNTTTKDGDSLIFSKGSVLELGVDKIKTSTTYTFILDIKENTLVGNGNLFQVVHNATSISSTAAMLTNEVGLVKLKITTLNNLAGKNICLYVRDNATSGEIKIKSIMLLEGDYTNVNIPYFEGMQSVKMPVLMTTGKNLINSEIIAGWINTSNGEINNLTSTTTCATKDLIKIKGGTQYSIYKEYNKRVLYAQFNENQEFINFGTYTHNGFTTDSNAVYVRLFFETPLTDEIKVMLYEGAYNSIISYEPYKTNILTVNEDVTLRSNGSVHDELDLLTGKLTQRIDENGEVLAQEILKTVGLNIQDQNGQNIKQLMSFNGGTHFTSGSAEGSLLPVVSVSVETDLEETLRVCSLEGNTM